MNSSASGLSIKASKALKISQVISQIFHFSVGETLIDFQQNAVAQLNQLLDFDSLIWLTSTNALHISPVNAFAFNLPNTFLPSYCTLLNQQPLSPENIINDSLCKQYSQQFDIHQQIAVSSVHANTQHFIILNRNSQPDSFNAEEKAILSFVTVNLVSAFHQCLQAGLQRHWSYPNSHKAVCDEHGYIIEAQNEFITTLQDNLETWDNTRLPERFNPQKLPIKFKYAQIKVEVVEECGLFVAQAYHFDQDIESLTPAETKIARLLLDAKSNKNIAQTLGRSEKTIEHQIKSVCTKLNVANRTEAIWTLKNSHYHFDS